MRPGAATRVGQRDRGAVGEAGERLRRADGDEPAATSGRRYLARLERQCGVAAAASGRHETIVQVFHRRLRVQRHDRVHELVRAQLRGHVGRDEDERVANRDLAAPHVRGDLLHRQAVGPPGLGQGQQVRLPDQVRLRGTGRDHVQLVAPHHRQADPDGTCRSTAERQPLPLGEEAPVGGPDRLLQAHDETSRFVVVVLALDGIGDEMGRLANPPPATDAGDNEEETPLGAGRRSNRRLDDGDGVRGVLEPLMLGHEAELHLESDGHAIRRT